MRPHVAQVLPFLALACASCGGQDSALGASRTELVGGDPSPSGGPDDAVLLLRATADGELICTATLIAPDLAVSARHCVAFGGPPVFQCTTEGELVENPIGGGTLGSDHPPNTIELYAVDDRDAPVALVTEIVSTLSETICKNDIAFLVLDRDVNLPARAIRLGTPTKKGESVDLVGYGATVTGEVLDYQTQQRWRIDEREIVDVGPDTKEGPIFVAPPRTLLLHGPAACYGDSGGPAFSSETGAIVGIFSILGGSNCSADNIELFYTNTTQFSPLVEQAFAIVGGAPIPEPNLEGPEPEPPAGDAGVEPEAPSTDDDAGCDVSNKRGPSGAFLALVALTWIVGRFRRKGRT